jgi:hypothetical protein
MAAQPTVYVIASDQHRNGKTLLARLITDFLLLDGHDPFLIDTDAPDGPLRGFFPGRTALADFASIKGQMRVFDTIIAAPGRDYVIDLPARHTERFFGAEQDLGFFSACKAGGFRVFLFYVVDEGFASLKAARVIEKHGNVDLFVPVRNMMVRSNWPADDGAMTIPFLPAPVVTVINNRRFSLRAFVQGDLQGLDAALVPELQQFLFETLNSLSNLEPGLSLKELGGK